MNALDLVLVATVVAAAIAGWRLGFVARLTSWTGLAIGVLVAVRVLPWVIDRLEGAESLRILLTVTGLLLAGASIGQLLGLFAGSRLRRAISGTRTSRGDRVAGAAAGVAGVLVGCWLLLPALTGTRDWSARQVDGSLVARAIDAVMPAPPDALGAIGRVVGEDRFPRVFDALQLRGDPGVPPATSGLSAATRAEVATSVVRLEGIACRRIQLGTGAVVAPGLVVTNAHVVAGQATTTVRRDDGVELAGTVVGFDPARDVALLAVPGLDRPVLPLGEARAGSTGAVFGHPAGGELRDTPFAVARRVTAEGTDIYDAARSRREVLFLAADLRPGDSGAPLVDAAGEMVGLAFAVAPDGRRVAYALTVPELEQALDEFGATPVDTGACLL